MHFSIRTKFLLLISVLLLLIFGTITLFQIKSRTDSLRTNLFEESRAFASLATQPIGNVFAIYKDSGTLKIEQQVEQFSTLNQNVTNIAIVDISGKVVYSQNEGQNVKVSKDEAGTFDPIYKNNRANVLNTIIYPYFEGSGAHRFTLVYTISDQEIEQTVRQVALQLFYFGLVSLGATMTLVYLLINRLIIKPVQQVSQQSSVISAGNLEQQILIHGHDEIATLGESVNKMAESLKANIAQLQEVDKVKSEFMMITSHNLRTPLTIISGYLDNMSLIKNDAEKLGSALQRIGASVKRLEIFAEDILTISRFELGDNEMQSENVVLGEFMKRIATEFTPTTEVKHISFTTDIQNADTQIKINVPYIRSAIWNILDNAAKFTKEGGKIQLSSKQAGGNVEISVSDNGVGIAAEELPKLFTKFHRGTSTLVYDFEGTGIGLYASKMMVEKHGGKVTVDSREGSGSTFTISLPLSPATS